MDRTLHQGLCIARTTGFCKGHVGESLELVERSQVWDWRWQSRHYRQRQARKCVHDRCRCWHLHSDLCKLPLIAFLVPPSNITQALWKGVRAWSKRIMEKAGERVLDVQGEDFDDDDDEEDEHEGTAPTTAQ